MKKRKELNRALNALYLEVDSEIADDIKRRAIEAMDEEYNRGVGDGKVIQEHGTINWST